MSNDSPDTTQLVLSDTDGTPEIHKGKRNLGGWRTHKPKCRCHPCTAYRRTEEALARATGEGAEPLDPDEELPVEEEPPHGVVKVPCRTPNTLPARIAEWIHWKALKPNISNVEIAEKMGISPSTLNNHISKAHKKGLIKFDDPLKRLEFEVIPKAVENLSNLLDKGSEKVTIEVARGTIFPQYRESKGLNQAAPQTTVLALKIEAPPAGTPSQVVVGQIVGKPRILEGEVSHGSENK